MISTNTRVILAFAIGMTVGVIAQGEYYFYQLEESNY
jgi:hypothetical protein